MNQIFLFDIDGTLLNTGGAGQRAMEQALQTVFGLESIDGNVLAAGRTDRAITTDLLVNHGIDHDDEIWSTFLRAYLTHLPEALAELKGAVLPGITALLETLSSREDVAMGLLTGNFREGAVLKLKHYKLDHHFLFGGYGDDHPDRDDVARLALAAAHEHVGRVIPADRVWVIGDTPADIRCARAIGARAVGVATGIYSYEQLDQATPDHLYHDFSDADAFLSHALAAS